MMLRFCFVTLLLFLAFPVGGIADSSENVQLSVVYPVVNPRVSSNFGLRKHPIFKASKHHNGVDLAAPMQAPVRAVSQGVVVFADPYAGYGKLVVIMHKSGHTTHYGHLNKINVTVGQRVDAGEIIAEVGSTGISTGPHLHFEVRKNGQIMDPTRFAPGLLAKAQG